MRCEVVSFSVFVHNKCIHVSVGCVTDADEKDIRTAWDVKHRARSADRRVLKIHVPTCVCIVQHPVLVVLPTISLQTQLSEMKAHHMQPHRLYRVL